jgi:NADH:ubiquinone oxidoreductase subunit 3 (subunit A)
VETPGLYLLGFLGATAVIVGAFLVGARLLRVATGPSSRLRGRPYECGEEPEGPVWIRFHPRYYVVALCFLVFDVEAVFLFPWALANHGLGWAGLSAVAAFVAILLLGWWYAVRKEALRWQ